jgi:surface antigen
MQSQKQVWNTFQQPKIVSLVVKAHFVVVPLLLLVVVISFGVHSSAAHARSNVAHTVQHTQQAAKPNRPQIPSTGSYNWFPYPACTWWANNRYHQLHGAYVPWHTQSDAWQWTARAYQFGWQVSSRPSWGAIINLQPWVQGAYGSGHVAVVEQVYNDGSVVASNSSWGGNPYQITYVHFRPGSGVTFIQW